MGFTPILIDELKVLSQFNLDSMQEGIKIHSSASEDIAAAANRLFEKGVISLPDGGYLTHRGVEVAKHAQILLQALSE